MQIYSISVFSQKDKRLDVKKAGSDALAIDITVNLVWVKKARKWLSFYVFVIKHMMQNQSMMFLS